MKLNESGLKRTNATGDRTEFAGKLRIHATLCTRLLSHLPPARAQALLQSGQLAADGVCLRLSLIKLIKLRELFRCRLNRAGLVRIFRKDGFVVGFRIYEPELAGVTRREPMLMDRQVARSGAPIPHQRFCLTIDNCL